MTMSQHGSNLSSCSNSSEINPENTCSSKPRARNRRPDMKLYVPRAKRLQQNSHGVTAEFQAPKITSSTHDTEILNEANEGSADDTLPSGFHLEVSSSALKQNSIKSQDSKVTSKGNLLHGKSLNIKQTSIINSNSDMIINDNALKHSFPSSLEDHLINKDSLVPVSSCSGKGVSDELILKRNDAISQNNCSMEDTLQSHESSNSVTHKENNPNLLQESSVSISPHNLDKCVHSASNHCVSNVISEIINLNDLNSNHSENSAFDRQYVDNCDMHQHLLQTVPQKCDKPTISDDFLHSETICDDILKTSLIEKKPLSDLYNVKCNQVCVVDESTYIGTLPEEKLHQSCSELPTHNCETNTVKTEEKQEILENDKINEVKNSECESFLLSKEHTFDVLTKSVCEHTVKSSSCIVVHNIVKSDDLIENILTPTDNMKPEDLTETKLIQDSSVEHNSSCIEICATQPSSEESLTENLIPSQMLPQQEITEQPLEEDSWDNIFDDSGECLKPDIEKEISSALGSVKIQKAKSDYNDFQPHDVDVTSDEFGHIIEIFGFSPEFKTRDLAASFSVFKGQGFDIKWVDDTHALGVFSSPLAASEALAVQYSLVKVRPLSQGIRESKLKAKKCAEFLQPYRPRPETSASLARRLVSGALGLKVHVPKEQRDLERQKLKEAKERRRQAAKQCRDVWDGVVS